MAQYPEGQRLQGSDGKVYVVRNGVPVVEAPSPLVTDPRLAPQVQKAQTDALTAQQTAPFAGPKAQADAAAAAADARIKQVGANFAPATTQADLEKTRAEAAKAQAELKAVQLNQPAVKQEQNAAALLRAAGVDLAKGIDPVAPLITGSTSGRLQHMGAEALGTVTGHATPGMENIAKLQTLVSDMVLQLTGGGLGNQVSDADREFIIQRVGNLADPNVPADQRLAAWEQVKQRMANILGVEAKEAPDRAQARSNAIKGAGAAPGAHGGSAPPPPTGPTGGIGPSSNGFNETPDPQSAQFWTDAARQQTPYRTALAQWQSDVQARGLVGITPPPPGAYHKAASYIRDHPNVPYQPFQSVERKPVDPLDQAATDIAFSGPAVGIGHTVNALAGTLPTALAGEQGLRYNAVSNAMHPNYAFAGDLAGTVGGALGAGSLVKDVAPRLGRFGSFLTANPARTGLAGDLLYGTTAGAANNPDNPLLGAGEGAAAMAAGNVAGRYLLGPAIRGGARAFNKTAGMFGAAPLDIPAPLSAGQNMIFNRANPVADIRTNLQDAAGLNLPYSLADADPRLRMLAGSAARKSPDVRAMAENVFGPRQAGQAERAIDQINTNLAPVGDVPTIMADARTRAQAASAPLFAKALAHPAPIGDKQLGEMLDTPAGQQAARNAYDIALNSGENPAELSFATGPDGAPVINANPNWKTLQFIKMGLDKVVTDNQNPVTGKLDLSNPANRALNDLRSRFVTRLGELNPDYDAANKAYSDIAAQGSAAQRGAQATSAKVTPEQTQIAVTNAGGNLPYFQRGYASDLADQVERSRLSGNPFNLIYGSMGQRAKIGTVFPQGAANFGRANALEGDMAKTGTELFGGSQTQPRAEADKLFANPMADTAGDIAFGLATGVPPPNLIRRGLASFAKDNLRLGFGSKTKADQIGPILLNTDPTAGLRALDELQKLALMRRGYVNQTGAYGGMFGAPLLGTPVIFGANQ